MRKVIYSMEEGISTFRSHDDELNRRFSGLINCAKWEIPKSIILDSKFANRISVQIIAEENECGFRPSREIIVQLRNSKVNLYKSVVFNVDFLANCVENPEKCFLDEWIRHFSRFERECMAALYNTAAAGTMMKFDIMPAEKHRREYFGMFPSKETMPVGDYIANDILSCMEAESRRRNLMKFDIDKVIYHEPATIVYWADGTKTVVKTQNGETYDPEKGLAMCFAKKARGNRGNYYEEFKKHLPETEEEEIIAKGTSDSLEIYPSVIEFVRNVKKDLATLSDGIANLHMEGPVNGR